MWVQPTSRYGALQHLQSADKPHPGLGDGLACGRRLLATVRERRGSTSVNISTTCLLHATPRVLDRPMCDILVAMLSRQRQ